MILAAKFVVQLNKYASLTLKYKTLNYNIKQVQIIQPNGGFI